MIQKNKRQRLSGQALAKMNQQIHERDDFICIIPGCGIHVSLGEKFHHEPCGKDKEDRIDKGVCLCQKHHKRRHFGHGAVEIRRQCEEYLAARYYPDGRERPK